MNKSTLPDDCGHGRLGMNVTEAGFVAGVGRDSIYKAIRSGDLVAKKYGRRTIIRRCDLDRFLASLPNLSSGLDRPRG